MLKKIISRLKIFFSMFNLPQQVWDTSYLWSRNHSSQPGLPYFVPNLLFVSVKSSMLNLVTEVCKSGHAQENYVQQFSSFSGLF